MNRFAASALAVMLMGGSSWADEKPAPEGCHWQSLPELKAHIAIPDGWNFTKKESDGALIYEVRPAGQGFEKSKAIFRMEVRLRTNKEDAVARARAFVEDARAKAVDPAQVEEQQVSTLTMFSCFVRLKSATEESPVVTAAVSSAANARTGTIYFTRFEISLDEVDSIAPLGNSLFRELRLDDEI